MSLICWAAFHNQIPVVGNKECDNHHNRPGNNSHTDGDGLGDLLGCLIWRKETASLFDNYSPRRRWISTIFINTEVNNCISIFHKGTKKLVYFCQYTYKWLEIQLLKRDFDCSTAQKRIVLANLFQSTRTKTLPGFD